MPFLSLGTRVHLGHPQRPEGGSLFLRPTFEVEVGTKVSLFHWFKAASLLVTQAMG